MNQLKVTPSFDIEGTLFIVDVEKQVLREFQNPANEISFIDHMVDKGTHYELRYDPGTNSVAAKHLSDDAVIMADVPQMTQLDPYHMAKVYGIPEEQLKGKPDFEVIVDQEALAIRKNGKLPLIDINGEPFVVDLRLHELRHAELFYPIISLKSFDISGEEGHYEGFYNTIMKQVVEIDPKLLEFPDHVVKIRLPDEVELDPIAIARDYGMDEKELLRRYPIQKDLKAEIIPLSETGIPALIQRNKELLQKEHEKNMQQAKPAHRHRPRF